MSKGKYPGVYPAMSKYKDSVTGMVTEHRVSNRWVLRICYTVNDKTYRQTKTVTANTEKQAYDMLVKIKAELEEIASTGANTKAKKMDFTDVVEHWIEAKSVDMAKGKFSPTTMASYKSALANYILPYFGRISIRGISEITINNYLDYINKNYNLADKTVRNQLMLISSVLTYAKKRGWIVSNPVSNMELEHICDREVGYFSVQQMMSIFSLLDTEIEELKNSFSSSIKYKALDSDERERRQNIRLLDMHAKRLFVHLAFVTGARRGEIISTTWNQLDSKRLQVEFNGTAYTLAGEHTKKKFTLKNGSKSKTVTFNSHLVPLIEEYKTLQDKVRKQNYWKKCDYIFVTTRNGKVAKAGEPMRADTMTHWFHDWCKANYEKIGLSKEESENAHVHMLRHSSITYGMVAGVPMKVLSQRAGHSSVNVTQKIYAHVTPEAARVVADQFGALYDQMAQKAIDEAQGA